MCACCARASVTFRSRAMRSSGVRFGWVNVDGEQLAVKAVRVPPSAGQHLRGVGPRRHAHEDAFLRAPRRLEAVQPQVVLELAIHDVGREQQRALPEHRQLRAALGHRRLGRRVDDDHFVGAVDEVLRHGLGFRLAEDAADELLLLGDVLEVDRRQNRDAGLEQLLDVLVALGVAAAGRVVVGEAVDQADARPAREQPPDVDDRDAADLAAQRDDLRDRESRARRPARNRAAARRRRRPRRARAAAALRRTAGTICRRPSA